MRAEMILGPCSGVAQTREITAGLSVLAGCGVECGPAAKRPGETGPLVRTVGRYVLDRRVRFYGGETVGSGKTVRTDSVPAVLLKAVAA